MKLETTMTPSSGLSSFAKLALAVMLLSAVFAIQLAQAQTLTVLHSFSSGANGSDPHAGVVLDGAENLYGTTYRGGAYGSGTVYMLDTMGNETVLHSFGSGVDGAFPDASLFRDEVSNLYGTTRYGGTSGEGTVFKLDSAGNETVLYSFTGGLDGSQPLANVIRDGAGNLYGTTAAGGTSKKGVVFKLDSSGTETVLHSFSSPPDGYTPFAGLVRDPDGNLYGTTLHGGNYDNGAVFKLTPNPDGSWAESVLYSFTGGADGNQAYGGVVLDPNGNLYGTTAFGGVYNMGVVFRVDTANNESVLHSFSGGSSVFGGPDGALPFNGLLRDAAGNLYGETAGGGMTNNGVVFKLDSSGKVTLLHSFTGKMDGASPTGDLVQDPGGDLYGVTAASGKGAECLLGCGGVVFKITP